MSPVTKKGGRAGVRPANAGQKLPPEVLTTDEVRQLLAACSRRSTTGIRTRALITVLWRAGLRISEALDLFPKDVGLEAGTIRVLHGKGDKARTVGVDAETAAVLETWLERRAANGLNGRHPLFCTAKGTRTYSSQVRTTLRRLGERAGLEKRVHPHGLRHSFAVAMLRDGVNVGLIKGALGHSSIATTTRYLEHLAADEVVDAMKRRV